MHFHSLEFILYFLRGKRLTLLPAHNPGLWPAIVSQGTGDRMVAVQVSQGARFLPPKLQGESIWKSSSDG